MKYKKSKQRESIYQYLAHTDSHPTAQDIYDAVKPDYPSLSLGTVYRNLNILEEQGKVKRLRYGSTFDHFDADTGYHYHFICRLCGSVHDFPIEINNLLLDMPAEGKGHRVESYIIDFYGVCSECRKN